MSTRTCFDVLLLQRGGIYFFPFWPNKLFLIDVRHGFGRFHSECCITLNSGTKGIYYLKNYFAVKNIPSMEQLIPQLSQNKKVLLNAILSLKEGADSSQLPLPPK